jgi:hypothetical protein
MGTRAVSRRVVLAGLIAGGAAGALALAGRVAPVFGSFDWRP